MPPTHIMLDLETLGTQPGSIVTAIGAVHFGGGQIHRTFYTTMDARDAARCGLQIDADTVLWWLKQGDQARLEITQAAKPLGTALQEFLDWLMHPAPAGLPLRDYLDSLRLWGNGATFDPPLLEAALRATGRPCPWNHRQVCCYRTVAGLDTSEKKPAPAIAHHALHDATAQALHLMQICPWL